MTQEAQDITISAEAPPSLYPCLGFEMQEHYANFVISLGPGTFLVQSVTAEQMNAICHQWLGRHSKKETH